MKHLSTAERQGALHALLSGAKIIAQSVDSAQTGVSPGGVLLRHIDPHAHGHDLSMFLPNRFVHGVGHAR